MLGKSLSFGALAIFLAPRLWLRYQSNQALPVFNTPEPYVHLQDVWSDSDLSSLVHLAQQQRMSTAVESYLKTGESKIPEIILPRLPNGDCPHWLFFPVNKQDCALVSRIDALMPFMITGGKSGAKVSMHTMHSIANNFQLYLFGENKERPEFQKLFQSDIYKQAAAKICGNKHPVQEGMQVQVSIITYLPGQELTDHYDVPWFTHANRHNTPQWLLIVMAKSGLFEADLMPQIQGVGFFQKNKTIVGGEFVFYDKGPGAEPTVIPSTSNSVILMDGQKILHGVNRVLPDRRPPPIGLSRCHIKYNDSGDVWDLENNEEQHLGAYKSEELRMSIAWRTLCFKSEKERTNWDPLKVKYNNEIALKVLEKDLRKRGRLSATEPRPPKFDFAMMLLDEYVNLPVGNLNNAWFPYNYCMLPHLVNNQHLKRLLHSGFDLIC